MADTTDCPHKADRGPSKVLYIKHVPDVCTEQDIMAYCLPFGKVTQVLLLRDKQHGFVEFEDLCCAKDCINYYMSQTLIVHGCNIEFAFSGRQQITNKKDPDCNPPNKILLLTVTNLLYPVTVDVLVQIFAKYGGMDKVVVFNRGNAIQALVQLRDVATSCICKSQLDAQNIYAGCNTLKVQFSSLDELEVRVNNDRSFDFTSVQTTISALSGFDATSLAMINGLNAYIPPLPVQGQAPAQVLGPGLVPSLQAGQAPVVIVHNIAEGITSVDDLAALFAVYGNVIRVKIMFKARHSALVQLQDLSQCRIAQQCLNGLPVHGTEIQVEMSKGGQIPPPRPKEMESPEEPILTKDFTEQSLLYQRHKPERSAKTFPPSRTLHISNMPDGTNEAQVIFALQQGGSIIQAIKFLDDAHHLAIVQCDSLRSAVQTLMNCHGEDVGEPPRKMRIGFAAESRSP